MALSIHEGFFPQILLWKKYPKLSLIDNGYRVGRVDIQNSNVLISYSQFQRDFENADSDYQFIQINENKVTKTSKIRWQYPVKIDHNHQNDYISSQTGLIDSDTLLLSAYGTILRVPIKNLSKIQEINLSCRSK